ncbi:MAG TPA: hypothetical protein VF190_11365 [Rhodothermales bacterium]
MREHDHRLREEEIFDQYPLFQAGRGLVMPDVPSPPRRRRVRPRGYDAAVLRYVGYYRTVTLHQVVYRFFLYDGKGPRYGFRLVADLVRRGLLAESPLDPRRGSVSRTTLAVTDAGWLALGLPKPRESKRAIVDAVREYRLQFADMMLQREVEGWVLVPEARSFATLRAWGLAAYRGRALTDSEIVFRDRLERMPPITIPLRVLAHRATGEARLILPVRRGKSFAHTIDALPSLAIFPPLVFEMVSPDPELARKADDYLRRWAERTRHRVRTVQSPHYRERPHPARVVVPSESLYRRHGVPDPRTLL